MRSSSFVRRAASLSALAASLALPAMALATDLTSSGGFLFDIQDEFGGGELSNGSIDAYDGCYYLDVGGLRYTSPGAGTVTTGGRQVEMGVQRLSGLDVRRLVYVPTTGDWGRYLEVLDNPGATDLTTTVTISGNLGSDGSTVLMATSSGDGTVDPTERWFATDDIDGSSDPSLAHLVQGGADSGAPISARALTQSSDSISWTFDVTVPAGGRAVIVTFAIQTMTQALAQAEAARLVDLPDDAWVGMDDYETDVVNFPPRTVLLDCTGARVGARCDDGLFCTRTDRCTAAGTCVGAGDPCNDGNACTVDTCTEATDACTNVVTADRCIIGGECVANGVVHPAYPCLYCDPMLNARDWSVRDPGTVCGAGSCSAGYLVPEATCSLSGQCVRAASEHCAVGYCADDTSCASMCAAGECPGDRYCGPSGACELPRADGSSCTGDPQCRSGHCVDAICCTEACTETCRSCIVPGSVGTCTDVPAMTDPDLECAGGFCDGAGACGVSDGGVLLDAAISADAGPRTDAGAVDAALSTDANVAAIDAAISPPDEGGGCRAQPGTHSTATLAASLLALVALLARRRR
ncbi:MAG: MYXO-CTERM sorting domain-containing protein [Sandaracinus sp.]